jgi:hypothetical protein
MQRAATSSAWACGSAAKALRSAVKLAPESSAEFAAQQAADVTAGNAAGPGQVALVHGAAFKAALQGDAEIAHNREKRKHESACRADATEVSAQGSEDNDE